MAETLIDRIKRHESFRQFIYMDTTGNATIGFGHKLTQEEMTHYADGITAEQAEYLLYADVAMARHAVENAFNWIGQLDQFRQDIVVEMCFQLGIGRLMEFHDFLFCLRSGDYVGACRNMLMTGDDDTPWYRQTPDRCAELAKLMEHGE